jgi:hypothetical protein
MPRLQVRSHYWNLDGREAERTALGYHRPFAEECRVVERVGKRSS